LVPLASATGAPARAEERRLLYVALTRAEDELWCSWAAGPATPGPADECRPPSPWLEAIEAACSRLAAEDVLPDPGQTAHHLAALRARLVTPAG
jgi:ATP-dependent exoDNAse (exonuclease V) beta subunit